MRAVFPVERYARCYPRDEQQYSDVYGRPLYTLIPSMQASQTSTLTNPSLPHTSTWTALRTSESIKIQIELYVLSVEECSIKVHAQASTTDVDFTLEALCFPAMFETGFKVSPKEKSLGFRYQHGQDTRFFQAIFSQDLDCRLCYDLMYRLGLLTPAWPLLQQFDNKPHFKVVPNSEAPTCDTQVAMVPENRLERLSASPLADDEKAFNDDPALRQSTRKTIEHIPDSQQKKDSLHSLSPDIVILSSSDQTLDDDISIQYSQERARRIILEIHPNEAQEIFHHSFRSNTFS